jgi:hypothetical protein
MGHWRRAFLVVLIMTCIPFALFYNVAEIKNSRREREREREEPDGIERR